MNQKTSPVRPALYGLLFGAVVLAALAFVQNDWLGLVPRLLGAITLGPFLIFTYYVFGIAWGDLIRNPYLIAVYCVFHLIVWSAFFAWLGQRSGGMTIKGRIATGVAIVLILGALGFVMTVLLLSGG